MPPPTVTCPTCDATVTDRPVFFLGLAFCCAGCAADGPCMCSYDPPEDRPAEDAAAVGADAPVLVEDPSPAEWSVNVKMPERVLVGIDA